MTAQTWRAHYAQKYQYSLRLFLLLNFISSSLSLVTPLFTVVRFTLPCALIVVCSGLLLLCLKNGEKEYISRKYLPEFKRYLGL